MSKIQELRPKSSEKPYTLADLDNEMVCMTMIKSLGDEYSNFASSVLLLKSLDKEEIKAAFSAEETNRRHRADASGDSALSTTSGACRCSPNAKTTGKRSKNANKASEASQPSTTSSSASDTANSASTPNSATAQSAQSSMEFAGNASLRSLTPSDPVCSCQIDADMTPHRHWMCNYAPKRVPIRWADHIVVYSAGIGCDPKEFVCLLDKSLGDEYSNVAYSVTLGDFAPFTINFSYIAPYSAPMNF
ncbi:hypothetical protein HYDPIDRAFT_32823 [Hydnomerulius pinastri MD-312]|uniref:Uncharacterized protein n=1 Tax=Hydnomerulius pinastri MD-312 TaxID=994086 RepID=A0A0C9V3D8_9AGAM|nr:hypothetical protein HYDPIDRAFT_32823 [Hydnomerulius pinastri MD-312]